MNKDRRIIDRTTSLLHDRSLIELWCDKYNHFMGLLRTLFAFINVLLGLSIFGRIFEVF